MLRTKYNPEAAEARAEKQIVSLTKGEYDSWRQHPCTKALEYTIEAELDRLVLDVVYGEFVGESVEASALKQAHAVGASRTLKFFEDYIRSMLENTQTDEDPYEEALRSTKG